MSNKRVINGWVPDLPDHRDFKYKAVARKLTISLPAKVDLRAKFGPCYDQGDLGSCTAHALGGHIEFLKGFSPSRLFIYYGERVLEGTVGQDSGAMLRSGIKVLANSGACVEPVWPYNVQQFTTKPPQEAYDDAAKHKIATYYRLATLADMKKCLSEGFPFVFGFAAYESFTSDKVAKSGILNKPTSTERMIGGHAVLAVGYDDATSRILVRNSWGPTWGQGGYFTMPYTYISSRMLSDDFWTIRA